MSKSTRPGADQPHSPGRRSRRQAAVAIRRRHLVNRCCPLALDQPQQQQRGRRERDRWRYCRWGGSVPDAAASGRAARSRSAVAGAARV